MDESTIDTPSEHWLSSYESAKYVQYFACDWIMNDYIIRDGLSRGGVELCPRNACSRWTGGIT